MDKTDIIQNASSAACSTCTISNICFCAPCITPSLPQYFKKRNRKGRTFRFSLLVILQLQGAFAFFFLSRMIAIAPPNNKSIAVYFLIFGISIYVLKPSNQYQNLFDLSDRILFFCNSLIYRTKADPSPAISNNRTTNCPQLVFRTTLCASGIDMQTIYSLSESPNLVARFIQYAKYLWRKP